MDIVLLALALLGGLLLIPFALPGTWVMIVAAFIFNLMATPAPFGAVTFAAIVALALLGEALEVVFMSKYARKYGGSRRAAWGAVIGGLVGALVGVPSPIVGSIVGAFAGAFLGAYALEALSQQGHGPAVRAATGAVIGRVVGAAAKVMLGCAIAAWVLVAALR